MKKTSLIIFLILGCVIYTGCGCSKNNIAKSLKCAYKDDTIDESFVIKFNLEQNAISFDSTKKYYFESNEIAKTEYSNFIGFDSVEVKDNSIIAKKHYDYEETEKISYDEMKIMYDSYECN